MIGSTSGNSVLHYLNRNSFFTQWAILAVALLTLGGATGFNLYLERTRTENREQNRLLTQAQVIQENLEQNLTAVSRVLADLRTQAPQGRTNPGLGDHLKMLTDAMPGIRTLLLLDDAGTVSASTRPELLGKNFAYRDYFKTARQNPDPDMLFVSAPFQTTLGVYGVNVARTIPGPHGEFAGIIAATLDPEYFRTLMNSVLYAPDMWVAIAHGDGLQVAMVPEREGQVGKNLAQPGSFFTRHRDSGKQSNLLTGIVYATGEERMMALRSIQPTKLRQDKPLVVAVGRDLNVVYAEWRRDFLIQSGLFGLIAFGSTAGLYAYRRRKREFARKQTEAARALAQSEWKLKTIIETEPECVKVLAADGTLLQMNRAGLQMIEAESDTQVIGHKMTELVTPEYRDAFDRLNQRVNRGESGTLEFEIVGLKGTHRWLDTHAVPMRDVNGRITGLLGVTRDITARKQVDQELKQLAQTDSLTDLANRRHFMALAEQELSRTLRYGGPLSVLMMDLDHFKNINDTYGHTIGDLVLQKFGGLVRQTLRDMDAVGRVGGEEFAVVLPQTDGEHALEVAERLCRLTADTEVVLDRGRPLHFTVSIGMTTLAGASSNIDTLLSQADQALYEAKSRGRNRVCVYQHAALSGSPEENESRRHYGALRRGLSERTPITVLHIGEEQTALAAGAGAEPDAVLLLAMGSRRTAADFFQHTPPTPGEMETAIMQVEDELTRARSMVAGNSTLVTRDTAIREIAQIAGVADGPTLLLSLEAVERLFDLLAALSSGRPASSAGIPDNPAFAATLLILREFMHHLKFTSISYRAGAGTEAA